MVHAIIREFERFPPLLWSNEIVNSPIKPITLPTVVDCNIPELSGLSIEELKLLDENEGHLNDFVEEMNAVQSLTDELDGLICDVEVITGLFKRNIFVLNCKYCKLHQFSPMLC